MSAKYLPSKSWDTDSLPQQRMAPDYATQKDIKTSQLIREEIKEKK